MSEMIERVAVVIRAAYKPDENAEGTARAILSAIREAPADMENAYFDMAKREGCPDCDAVFPHAVWERAVDAALAREKQPA